MKKLLKTCLLGLCAFFSIASFCNADFYNTNMSKISSVSFTYNGSSTASDSTLASYFSTYRDRLFYIHFTQNDCGGNLIIPYNFNNTRHFGYNVSVGTDQFIYMPSNMKGGSSQSSLTTNINVGNYITMRYSTCTTGDIISFDLYITNDNFVSTLNQVSDESDMLLNSYLSCSNNLSTCNNNLSTLSGNYSSCLSDNSILSGLYNDCVNNTPTCPAYKLYIADLSNGFNEYTINEDINLTYDSSDIDFYRSSDFSFEFGVNSNNRISKSSVNQNYCTSNNLCPTCPTCQLCTGYSIKLYDVSDEENPSLEYSGTVENNRNIYYSGVNVDQGLLGATKSFTFYGEDNSCPSCPSCPDQMTRLECQSYYSLVPLEDITQSYCENNNLCPVCTPATGDLIFSNVYINDILHPGRASVFVNIPDYIFWDYSVNDSEFNIYVGSGYDVDYIDSIVAINSYRPTTEDFTDVFVGGLTLIMPYVMIILFIVFVRKFIKRIFK